MSSVEGVAEGGACPARSADLSSGRLLIDCPLVFDFETGIVLNGHVRRREADGPERALTRVERNVDFGIVAAELDRERGIRVELAFHIPG